MSQYVPQFQRPRPMHETAQSQAQLHTPRVVGTTWLDSDLQAAAWTRIRTPSPDNSYARLRGREVPPAAWIALPGVLVGPPLSLK